MSLITRQAHYVETIQASTTQTATGTGSSVRLPEAPNAIIFTLDADNTAGIAPTLDVTIQTKLDGTNWLDVVAFSQVTTTDKRFHAKINGTSTMNEIDSSTAISPPGVRQAIGDEWRASWTITGTGPSYTFSVKALVM